jgi:ammonia channel protein AmtB
MLVSAALVLFMTPGLAFLYGGMVRAKNVLGLLMQNYFAMGLVSVLWAVVGFSFASTRRRKNRGSTSPSTPKPRTRDMDRRG